MRGLRSARALPAARDLRARSGHRDVALWVRPERPARAEGAGKERRDYGLGLPVTRYDAFRSPSDRVVLRLWMCDAHTLGHLVRAANRTRMAGALGEQSAWMLHRVRARDLHRGTRGRFEDAERASQLNLDMANRRGIRGGSSRRRGSTAEPRRAVLIAMVKAACSAEGSSTSFGAPFPLSSDAGRRVLVMA